MLRLLARQKHTISMPKAALPVMLLTTLAASGCASTQMAQEAHPEDPWEGFNRRVFVFNDVLDRYALKPVAKGYRTVTPDPVQTGIGNFFSNLGEIRTVINSLLQGKPANAGLATSRFLINTTVGIGGLLDYATLMEITADDEDFGQTLAAWGWEDSRYLVLPLLGPSTLRDTTGLPADMASYPTFYIEDDATRLGLMALNVVDIRAGLLDQEDLIQGDRYRFIRDAFLQRRQFEINDGQLGDDPFAMDSFDFDDSDFSDDDFAD
ncbi:MlaA family lipoprotein [Vreelandella populi]|uniref:VacJ family lipoprotein n=1 Tax=Vreelandella populi TaxID=2498858 RepID=A0A3S0ZBK0_9GAMM|nr:VacJ family lipoprotein [Halomonas populi]RUR36124.1 VacJ family lipoprotein [Halomonas populi]RUR43133.1 VacJ family lipoprotein [Halomonas populi]RUR57683.1 VacJ family lipoprotein [Halomonas populi]